MLIIGEKINTTRKGMEQAVRDRNEDAIREEAIRQAQAGAHILDVNCGTLPTEAEPEALSWLVQTAQSAVDLPLCVDSPNPAALAAGLAVHQGKPMINSISGEKARYAGVLPMVKQYQASVVALGMDDRGIPQDKNRALEVGVALVNNLVADGVPLNTIYFDPLVRSLATSPGAVLDTLEVMKEMSSRFPGLHFVSGLSNVSFGLPERKHLNRAFVVLSVASGLDAVIMDPLDVTMVAQIYAAEALMNRDRFCRKYIEAFRQGKLKV
jgi:5-methyltetrahydrofolate corrinoid/iron sulfur protein methyltransferase